MSYFFRPLLTAGILLMALICKAQLDTSFWFAAPEVSQGLGNDRPIVLRISTLSQAATVAISMPTNIAFTPITVTIGVG